MYIYICINTSILYAYVDVFRDECLVVIFDQRSVKRAQNGRPGFD